MDHSPEPKKYTKGDFELGDGQECDMIMKGGLASGIVYPYAVLEVATKFRLCSLGGTSAGAIAATLAAAAEYSRTVRDDPAGFVRLQKYCNELPDALSSLFQPDPEFGYSKRLFEKFKSTSSIGQFVLTESKIGVPVAIGLALLVAIPFILTDAPRQTLIVAFLLGFSLGLPTFLFWLYLRYLKPISKLLRTLPSAQYGLCSGLTQDGYAKDSGLTDWLHKAIQDVAFGDPDHPNPLTFGDLENNENPKKRVHLRMVATNLSMRRPHTLPRLGITSGFKPEEWKKLFPTKIMDFLTKETKPLKGSKETLLLPEPSRLPVLVAVRMSLSFPILFKAIPLVIEDHELKKIVSNLSDNPRGDQPKDGAEDQTDAEKKRHFREVWISDGGISSNFPVHMFDNVFPSRPTFAFSLDSLDWDPKDLSERVLLPEDASGGLGVPIDRINDLSKFIWSILNSAKDWQDQLLSEMTGQRERVARIYLMRGEGGMNLDMDPEVSRDLMSYGYAAGKKFADGGLDFDEHRWRRALVLHKNLSETIGPANAVWEGGFGTWFEQYLGHVASYKKLTKNDRKIILSDFETFLANSDGFLDEQKIKNSEQKFPKKRGRLKISPTY